MSTSPLELQKLWRGLQRQPWKSLAVVPAHPGGPSLRAAEAILQAAAPFADAGPLHLLDATALDDDSAPALLRELKARAEAGRVVVALPSPLVRPATLHLVLASDAALLCVTLGESDLTSATRTLEQLGRERFVGSVTLPRQRARR